MADDLKLQLLIQALLDSKGFDDAKAAITGLATTTNQSAPAVEGLGKKSSELTRVMGGTRGAAADLTRVMLQSIGVTGAAGEAAKAAGLGMNFLAGAAGGLGFAMAGAVAALAFLVPKVVQWMTVTEKTTDKQQELLKAITDQLPALESYAAKLTVINEALYLQLTFKRAETLRAEREELKALNVQYTELKAKLQDAMDSNMGLTREFTKGTEKLMLMKGRIDDLTAAERAGITVEEMYARRIRETTKAVEQKTVAVKKLEAAEDQQSIDAIKDMADDNRRRDKEDKDRRKREADLAEANQERQRQIKQETAEEIQAYKERRAEHATMVAAAFGALSTAFGQNKAIRIAGAIADTYAAANLALATYPPPAGAIWAGIAIAQGLANVAAIRKAEVGFDDPVNDMLAAQLDRKFAVDVLQHINAGFGSGLRERAAGNTYQNHTVINRGTTVNMGGVSGVIGNRAEFEKWFERTMVRAQRVQRRTSI